MNIFYNNQAYQLDLVIKRNDTVNMTFNVFKFDPVTGLWNPHNLTGMRIDIQFRRKDGLLVKDYSSVGSAEITIINTYFNIYDVTGFTDSGLLDFDIQVTDGTDRATYAEGTAWIKKDITI